MNIDNLRLRTKTLLPLSLMALTVLAMVAFGASRLASVTATASDIIEHRAVALTELIRAARLFTTVPYDVLGTLTYDSDTPEGRAAEGDFAKSVTDADEMLQDAAKLVPDKAEQFGKFKDRFDAIAEKAKAPFKIGQDAPGLANGRKLKPEDLDLMAKGAKLAGEVDIETRALIQDIVAFNNRLRDDNTQAASDLRAQSSEALVTMSAVGLLATLLAGSFALWMSSVKIAGPLARLAQRMNALAKGDLAVTIEGQERKDEVGEMAVAVQVFKTNAVERARLESETASLRTASEAQHAQIAAEKARAGEEQAEAMRRLGEGLKSLASGDLRVHLDDSFSTQYAQIRSDFNEAVEKLKETMQAVATSTGALHSGTNEIKTASDDLSQRTEQQAAGLEETAAALGEITATVERSAEGAKHAHEIVASANQDARKSAVVVRQTVEAMDAIAVSSRQIGQVIGVIDEIAFQTNLLALNAGVEAARAGDSGRGFAVVAMEVRALAQRSADAAKEIKALVSTSTVQVDIGVKLVGETGTSLERIIAQVTEINDVVAQIAAGAQEQATALQQVNTAINQMDQTTQQNATMVEESTAASHSLSQEATQLSGLIERFQLGRVGDGSAMRRELEKVASHMFQKPANRPTPRVAKPKLKMANASGSSKSSESWREF